MLLPTAAQADAQGKLLSPQKQAMQCPRGSGEGRGEGVSPVLVFSECQFELHCIHQEVVEIMGNNGSPGVWTMAGAPWDGDGSVTKGF